MLLYLILQVYVAIILLHHLSIKKLMRFRYLSNLFYLANCNSILITICPFIANSFSSIGIQHNHQMLASTYWVKFNKKIRLTRNSESLSLSTT